MLVFVLMQPHLPTRAISIDEADVRINHKTDRLRSANRQSVQLSWHLGHRSIVVVRPGQLIAVRHRVPVTPQTEHVAAHQPATSNSRPVEACLASSNLMHSDADGTLLAWRQELRNVKRAPVNLMRRCHNFRHLSPLIADVSPILLAMRIPS